MKVTIFQYRLFHYRRQLFELLREKCRVHGIDLVLVHGQPYRDEIKKKDDAVLPWATQVRNRYFPVREKKDLCWQPTPELVRGSDLVVLMQENRLLANYVWLLRRMLGTGPLLAFWGHGRDFQSRAPGGLRERWKSLLINRVDWWFAYTSVTAQVLHDAGFPHDRITVLDNAVDNPQFERDLACVSEPDRVAMRTELGLTERHFVGLYCSSLYFEKRLDVLFAAAERIYRQYPDFRLLLIGDGVDRPLVETACAKYPWATYLGSQYGMRKAILFKLANLLLCPGLVGLNILDAFVAGLPLITLSDSLHSPEIAYLAQGENGYSVTGGAAAYADQVLELIRDERALQRLSAGALATASRYTLDNMAQHFVDGLLGCLKRGAATTSAARA